MCLYKAAATVIELCQQDVTNLRVQKILYISHMLAMGSTEGRVNLVDGAKFYTWKYGPVQPDLYKTLKSCESTSISTWRGLGLLDKNDEQYNYVENAVPELDKLSTSRLIEVTHWEKGAWARTFVKGGYDEEITEGAIIEEYRAWGELRGRRPSENSK